MENIDLDAIIADTSPLLMAYLQHGGNIPSFDNQQWGVLVKTISRKAINQALVLASEKATAYVGEDENGYVAKISKQSILDIEKLIK